ncbi:hypothetical protein JYU34_016142 [Plutella xylostella]|uniref:Uncharacterized protein n=1 Tax=Plutella xylostella TaxID=51655 RepID=A0ABQ7Q5I8_PLUXY|nr:hypothetical protein JYU34_016142 [Plutella xylostella]
MESPVRICLGAALVVCLLLLSSTPAAGDTTPAPRDERTPKHVKINSTTWLSRNRAKSPDVALNELNPKETVSDEDTDKNAKYKDRGRARFNSQTQEQRTQALRSRVRSALSTSTTTTTTTSTTTVSGPKLMIVTPEPEKKNVSQIMQGMRSYKKTKMPLATSSTTPVPKSTGDEGEEYSEEFDDDDKDSYEKFSTSKFHESTDFHIPSFADDNDFSQDSTKEASENKVHKAFSIPSYDKFSTYFPKEISYSSNADDEPYKSESFFSNFETDLTTPRNDFFDKKFKEVSSSIIKNLDVVKTKSTSNNKTNIHKRVKEDVDLAKRIKSAPTNKSTVIIKNTKEVRLLDNEKAGSTNQELSDVHGTSIYYEMSSILSTETYSLDQSDDDCDNDTVPNEPTPSTTEEEETRALPATSALVLTTKPTVATKPEDLSTSTPNTTSVINTVATSQNSILSTEESLTTKVISTSYSRNRSYKRYNMNGTREPNKIATNDQVGSNQVYRPVTRSPLKFHYTTPKSKPVWMSPRNVTRTVTRTKPMPTTIYFEHFDISDKVSTTPRPRQPNRNSLTTQTSEIDPVLQTDVGGVKKVVHSPSISDNSIPSLWKRGSAKFSSSTAASAETEASDNSGTSDLEIPPTLTAWALASLRSPPSFASPVANASTTTPKTDDENELQKVGEVSDHKETTTSTTTTSTTVSSTVNDGTTKLVTEIEQNKLPSRTPLLPSSSTTEAPTTFTTTDFEVDTTVAAIVSDTTTYESETEADITEAATDNYSTEVTTELLLEFEDVTTGTSAETTETESKSERLPAESNISVQSSAEPATTDVVQTNQPFGSTGISAADFIGLSKPSYQPPPWWSGVNTSNFQNVTIVDPRNNSTLPAVSSSNSKSAGFESITKLPSGITTPQGDDISPVTRTHEIYPGINTALPTTTDYDITTYRSSYVPLVTTSEPSRNTPQNPDYYTPYEWRPILPSKSTVVQGPSRTTNIFENAPITTYRPTTGGFEEEATTIVPETTTIEIQIIPETTPQILEQSTTVKNSEAPESEQTTIIPQTVTDSKSERESSTKVPVTPAVQTTSAETVTTSEENSGSNEVITLTKSTTTPKPEPTSPVTKTSEPSETTSIETETLKELTTGTESERLETTTQKLPTTVITGGKVYDDVTERTEDNEVESTTDYSATTATGELEASSGILSPEEAGSGAAIAITVSTIGVITLILLIGLLLVVRRRGRRGVYAQRCTPVSLDAYSLDSVSVGPRKGRGSKRSYGNPGFDDEVTSHPMQYAALANFALDSELMTREFSSIPSVAVSAADVPPGAEDKNRYSNVLPLPETRVLLNGSSPVSCYINANYVTGPGNIKNYYIACQAPLPNTVDDFWQMIWEQNSRLIVMLTEYMENGVEKSYEYLPPSEISDSKRTFGDYQVVLKKREQHDKYAISTVQLINLRTRTWRELTHLWYFWPAKGVPDDYDSMIDFLTEMRGFMKIAQSAKEFDEDGVEVIYGDQHRSSFHKLSKLRSEDSNGGGGGVNVYSPARAEEQLRRNNDTLARMKASQDGEGVRPCVVVCSSGAGRSAAVIALDVGARALAAGAVDVPRVVRELRAQRPQSLANRHHYIFVYKVLSEYGNKLMGGGNDTI